MPRDTYDTVLVHDIAWEAVHWGTDFHLLTRKYSEGLRHLQPIERYFFWEKVIAAVGNVQRSEDTRINLYRIEKAHV